MKKKKPAGSCRGAAGASCTDESGDESEFAQLNADMRNDTAAAEGAPATPAGTATPGEANADTVPGEAAIKADESGKEGEKKGEDFSVLKGLEHCPDFNERFTLRNGRTKAIAYPADGFNCSAEYGLV